MTFEQLLEQADILTFNKLCNNSDDHCVQSIISPINNRLFYGQTWLK